jgi:DNA repair exonuclease SbcCD ATPase subunit
MLTLYKNEVMTQEQPTNFNREIDRMLTKSEQRIEQLRELNRPMRPWEKDRFKERLSKLENQETWDKAELQERLTQLKKDIKIVSFISAFVILMLFICCVMFSFGLWKTLH